MSEQRRAAIMIILIMSGSVALCVFLGVILGDDVIPGRSAKVALPGPSNEEQTIQEMIDDLNGSESTPTPNPEADERENTGIVARFVSSSENVLFLGAVLCLGAALLVIIIVGGILLFQPLERNRTPDKE